MRPKWLVDLAVVLSLAGASAVLWWLRVEGPATGRLNAFGNLDQFTYFHPLYSLTARRWASGELPLWNRWQLAGAPLAAAPQTGAFYLPNLLYVVLETEVAMRALAFAHVVLAGALLYALARVLGAGRVPAFIGGLAYAWSSFVIGWHLWPPCVGVLAWFPLPLIGIAWIARGKFVAGTASLALGLAVQLLIGHMPLALFGCQAAAAYACHSTLQPWVAGRRRDALVQCCWLAGGFGLALLVSAVQWLPTLELSQLATRNPGGLTRLQIEPYGSLPLTHWPARFEPAASDTAYAGALAFLLLPAAFVGRKHRAEVWFFLALAAAFGVVAFGSSTPLFDLYLLLPGSNLFRGPQRALCVVTLAISVVAALGADALLSRQADSPRLRRRTWAALGLAIGVTAYLAVRASAPVWAVAAGVIVIAFSLGAPVRFQRYAQGALILISLADLAWIPRNVERQVWRPEARAALDELDHEYRALAAQFGLARVIVPWNAKHRVATYARAPAQRGLYVFSDYEPLSLRRYADYASFTQYGRSYDPAAADSDYSGDFNFRRPLPNRRLLAAAGVHAIVRVRSTREHRPFLVLEAIPSALPRAYLVHGVRAAGTGDQTLQAIADGTLPLTEEVALESPPAAAGAQRRGGADLGERARVLNYESERVVIEAVLTRPGVLVLLDADYPGWRASIDGKPDRIYNANYVFRGVLLQPGVHRVEFRYAPASVRYGIALSACGLVSLSALCVLARRRRRIKDKGLSA